DDPWCEHFTSREHARKVRNWAPGTTVNPEHPGAVPPPPRALGWGACAAAPPPAPAWGAWSVASEAPPPPPARGPAAGAAVVPPPPAAGSQRPADAAAPPPVIALTDGSTQDAPEQAEGDQAGRAPWGAVPAAWGAPAAAPPPAWGPVAGAAVVPPLTDGSTQDRIDALERAVSELQQQLARLQ
ncbi:unnamed protein product, partial [Prorocentrum cordatum]